jgi:very-short-patch-repair endonuclease
MGLPGVAGVIMKGQTSKAIREGKLQRKLRNQMTYAEQRLWRHLRGQQMQSFKFRRQHPFGDYILDFACLELKLVIEVDGGQHAQQEEPDNARSAALHAAGLRVLRFWNNEVLQNTEAVVEAIGNALRTPPPP